MRSEFLEVRVSNRVLHVGRQAYPLRNVTRVEPTSFTIRRDLIIGRFIKRAGITVGIGSVVVCGLSSGSAPAGAWVMWVLALAAVLAWQVFRMVRELGEPDLHVLQVETAGTAKRAVISPDRDLIYGLAERVIEAIDNPNVEYRSMVNYYHVGDHVLGSKYGGDTVLGDKLAQ